MWTKQRQERQARREARRAEAKYEHILGFEQCEACSYDVATGEGARSCHWGACPYLPEELDVFCPTCNYDFYTREGRAECGDPPRCDFARREAPRRVSMVRAWLERHPHVTEEEVLDKPPVAEV